MAMVLILPVAQADECDPVQDFIALGDRANKCVVAVRLNQREAVETFENDAHCKGVRSTRSGVEDIVGKMPPAAVNRCANKNQRLYTGAATALQKMYQLELSLKTN